MLSLVLVGILASGSVGCAVEEGDDGGGGCAGGKCDGFNVEWSSRIENVVPEDVHN